MSITSWNEVAEDLEAVVELEAAVDSEVEEAVEPCREVREKKGACSPEDLWSTMAKNFCSILFFFIRDTWSAFLRRVRRTFCALLARARCTGFVHSQRKWIGRAAMEQVGPK